MRRFLVNAEAWKLDSSITDMGAEYRTSWQKLRHRVGFAGLVWKVDEFLGNNKGLLLAEVEVSDSNQEVPLPSWVGEEVTENIQYCDAHLSQTQYTEW